MLNALRGIVRGKPKDHVINRYTKDLAAITTTIHDLQRGLTRNDDLLKLWQRGLIFYGSTIIVIGLGIVYAKFFDIKAVVISLVLSLFVMLVLKRALTQLFQYQRSRIINKLNKARVLHQEKLEELKKETNFYSTNSLIQRFSSGQNQAEDALTLMDEEVKSKYEELRGLQKELKKLKTQVKGKSAKETKEQTDKWFDKVLGVLAGDDISTENRVVPLICKKCEQHTGCYILQNTSWKYVCPNCGWLSEKVEDEPPATESQKAPKDQKPKKEPLADKGAKDHVSSKKG
ncbi:Lnp1p Ecym_5172 [Eremothecium cymbalariae DBVPG|uniref:Endoplasmic reticulum junction formation protein lunapark n=1 Tax=Eremothecium cymbalariae (strain CBS 270.75 / DBVPG 7215 / KCTC 17166 / NRRL Y-17582) TaxID=931890 RepID=I6ND04_ERECY|nr:hypothetical protein Ecym_5172 [Eremothecium cymbalariae DBVPG\